MKRIIISALVCTALIFTVCAADKNQVVEKWRELKPSFFDLDPYVQKPVSGEVWTAGELKSEFVADGLNYLNFCRFIAGLPDVTYTDTDKDNLQKAALLYSAAVFSDTETIPPYMSDAFYTDAHHALENSLTSFGFDNLEQSVAGLINSRGANMMTVSSRTVLLSHSLEGVGFGFYDGYAAVATANASEEKIYDFTAWPAPQAFPTMLFKENLPWSVTLDPKKYSLPKLENIMIRLQNNKTGTTIELKAEGEYSYYNDNAVYLGINPETYTIIFKPHSQDVQTWSYNTDYDVVVTIFGIYTAEGEETSLQYTVNFFDMDSALLTPYSDGESIGNHHKTAVADMSASGIFNGYPDGTFRPHDNITRAEFTAALLRYMGIQPSLSTEVIFEDVTQEHWAKGYIDKAAEIGAVNGTAPGIFSPEETVTAEQAMKIVTIVKGFADKMDVEASGGYPLAYYNLGYELGLMDYVDDDEIFNYPLTRSDAARILYNSSIITKFWIERTSNHTIIWHRDRSGKGYGYYSFVKFTS